MDAINFVKQKIAARKDFKDPAEVLTLFEGTFDGSKHKLTLAGEIISHDHFTAEATLFDQIVFIMPEVIAPQFSDKKQRTYPFPIRSEEKAATKVKTVLEHWEQTTEEWITLTDIFQSDLDLRFCVFFVNEACDELKQRLKKTESFLRNHLALIYKQEGQYVFDKSAGCASIEQRFGRVVSKQRNKKSSVSFTDFAERFVSEFGCAKDGASAIGVYTGFEMETRDRSSLTESEIGNSGDEETRLWAAFTKDVGLEALQCVYNFYFRLHWSFLPQILEATENRFERFWRNTRDLDIHTNDSESQKQAFACFRSLLGLPANVWPSGIQDRDVKDTLHTYWFGGGEQSVRFLDIIWVAAVAAAAVDAKADSAEHKHLSIFPFSSDYVKTPVFVAATRELREKLLKAMFRMFHALMWKDKTGEFILLPANADARVLTFNFSFDPTRQSSEGNSARESLKDQIYWHLSKRLGVPLPRHWRIYPFGETTKSIVEVLILLGAAGPQFRDDGKLFPSGTSVELSAKKVGDSSVLILQFFSEQ